MIADLKGVVPARADMMPLNYARVAVNCDFSSGELRPGASTVHVQDIQKTGTIRTIHKLGAAWIYWDQDVSVAQAVTSTDRRQIYFAGDGPPQITDESMATAGSPAEYPAVTHLMGVPTPSVAPSVAISKIEPSEAYGDVIEPVAYVYTCLAQVRDEYIIESGVSPTSVVLDARRNMKLTVGGLTVPDGVDHVGYRVYRLRAGSDATYRAVPFGSDADGKPIYDIPASETDFVDVDTNTNSVKLSLGDICEVDTWEIFPADTTGLVEFQNSMVIGLRGNEIIPSAPLYQYPAIMTESLLTAREIVGGRAFGDIAVIVTEERPFVLSGSEPGMLMLSPLPFDQGCLSERGMAVVEGGVYYPSPEGMVFCDGASAVPVTKNLWRKDQWAALHPETMVSLYHDGVLYLFFKGATTGVVWDFRNEYVTTLDVGLPVYHGCVVDDALYLLVDDGGYKIHQLSGTQNYTWATSWTADNRTSPSRIRFDGDFDGKTVTVTVTADGQTFSKTVSSTSPVALKSMRGRKITLSFTGNAHIKGFDIG